MSGSDVRPLSEVLTGVHPTAARIMVQGATDLRHLVEVYRAAPDDTANTALLDALDADGWTEDRTLGVTIMAVVALAAGIEIP